MAPEGHFVWIEHQRLGNATRIRYQRATGQMATGPCWWKSLRVQSSLWKFNTDGCGKAGSAHTDANRVAQCRGCRSHNKLMFPGRWGAQTGDGRQFTSREQRRQTQALNQRSRGTERARGRLDRRHRTRSAHCVGKGLPLIAIEARLRDGGAVDDRGRL